MRRQRRDKAAAATGLAKRSTRAPGLALAQRVLAVLQQRGHQVAEDGARSGLDLRRHGHAGRQLDHLVADLHLAAVEGYAGEIAELLVLRLARARFRPARLVGRLFASLLARHRVLRNAQHLARQHARSA